MARRYLTPIDLTGLELTNFKVQNLTSNPTPYGAGHTYYNTTDKELRTYNGTSWDVVGGNVISGATSARPAAGHAGRLYFDTQKSVLFFDNGTSWIQDGVTSQDLADAIDNATLGSTDDLNEGTTNLYYTDARAEDAAGYLLKNASLTNITIDYNGTDLSITAENGVADSTTDDLEEGSTNLYFTDQRAQDAIDDATMTLSNKTIAGAKITGTTSFRDGSDVEYASIERSGTGTTRVVSVDDISIRSQNGDIILYPGSNSQWGGDGGTGKAYVNWGNDATGAAPENEITTAGNIQVFTNKTVNDELYFTNPSTIPNDGGIKINDSTEDFEIKAYSANLSLSAINGDINLYPDGAVRIASGSNLHVGNNIYVKNGIYAGGSNTGTDGYIRIQDASGSDVFKAFADVKIVEVDGELDIFKPNGGNQVGAIYGDNDDNLVINANQNNLVLHSDSGNAYMNSVSADNRIIKYSEIAALQSGLDWKTAVNLLWDDPAAALTGVSGTLAIDDHTALSSADNGYRILITNSTTVSGIYSYSDDGANWTLTRTEDADAFGELVGAAVFVMEGDVYGATSWVQSNHYLTDFTNQTWTQFSGQGTYLAGDGISIVGQTFSVKLDETNTSKSGLKEDANGLSVKLNTNSGLKSTSDGLAIEYGAGLTQSGNAIVIDTTSVVRKYAATIAQTGTATEFTITHNLGTEDVTVSVYDTVTKEVVITDVTNFTTNTVKIGFAEAPADGAYRVVIHG